MPTLRPELLRFPQPDGGLELLDLVLEQLHTFSPEEAAALQALEDGTRDALPPALEARMQQWLLYESPSADALRAGCKFSRKRSRMPAPDVDPATGRWDLASTLPPWVGSAWRNGERWRRLAEDRLGGRTLLRLEGFMDREAAHALRARAEALNFERQDSLYARGGCHNLSEETLGDVLGAFRSGPLSALIGDVLGESMPSRIFARVWKLERGDGMGVHNDGIHYVGTFSLGLCEGWTAQAGGSIAFGIPGPGGLHITERWLPHLGDLLLFRPTGRAWHAVDTVNAGVRMTITGHYVSPEYGSGIGPEPD